MIDLSEFTFTVSEESKMYCYEIVDEMIKLFGISREEVILRLNNHWGTMTISDDALDYYLPIDFAYMIYYGPDKQWWKEDKSDLVPRPLRKE